jgi:hypothetical protein
MAAGFVQRSAHDQRAPGIALDQQDHLAVAQQRCQGSRHRRLRIAAGHDNDDIGAVYSRLQIACGALDSGEPGLLALDIDAAEGSDIGKPRIVDVVQPQFVPSDPQFGCEVDSAYAGADDRHRLDCVSARHDCLLPHS